MKRIGLLLLAVLFCLLSCKKEKFEHVSPSLLYDFQEKLEEFNVRDTVGIKCMGYNRCVDVFLDTFNVLMGAKYQKLWVYICDQNKNHLTTWVSEQDYQFKTSHNDTIPYQGIVTQNEYLLWFDILSINYFDKSNFYISHKRNIADNEQAGSAGKEYPELLTVRQGKSIVVENQYLWSVMYGQQMFILDNTTCIVSIVTDSGLKVQKYDFLNGSVLWELYIPVEEVIKNKSLACIKKYPDYWEFDVRTINYVGSLGIRSYEIDILNGIQK